MAPVRAAAPSWGMRKARVWCCETEGSCFANFKGPQTHKLTVAKSKQLETERISKNHGNPYIQGYVLPIATCDNGATTVLGA